jgi:hypothetical protein
MKFLLIMNTYMGMCASACVCVCVCVDVNSNV